MHILIVEDDLDLGRAPLESLKAEGITSEWVRCAADARVAVESAVIHCVLLDVSLPDGMGYDLLDAGTVVSKGVLSQRLEPLGEPVDFSTIEVHISNLRRRIGSKRIRTVRGVGYMLVP